MPTSYNSNLIIPAPLVQWEKGFETTEDGQKLGSLYNIQINGTMLSWKGSPNASGVFHTTSGEPADTSTDSDLALKAILIKQQALRQLFATEGLTFEVTPLDGSAPTKFNPRNIKIVFQEGPWVETCGYTITCEADILYLSGEPLGEDSSINEHHIKQFTEAWNIEAGDEIGRTYRVTRQLSATGKRFYDENGVQPSGAWEYARNYILGHVGLGLNQEHFNASGVLDLQEGFEAFNYVRTTSTEESAGRFTASETWLAFNTADGYAAYEDYTVDSREEANGRLTVTINGSVTGLEKRNDTSYALISTRYSNAAEYFDAIDSTMHSRAQSVTGYSLHPLNTSSQIGRNINNGVITYSYEYNDRPANVISGTRVENLAVNYRNATDVFARIPILGRTAGPLLQSIGTVTEKTKSINYEAILEAADYTGYIPTQPNTDAFMLTLAPVATYVFVSQDNESWDAINGRYSRQVEYTYSN